MGIKHKTKVVLTKDKNLEDALFGIDVSTIEQLTIKGELNCESIKYLHDKMSATLVELDISEANVINDNSYKCDILRLDKGEKWIHILGLRYFEKLQVITLGPSITNYEVIYTDTALQEFPVTDTLFDAPYLQHIEIHNDNPILYSVDGVVYTRNGILIKCPECKEGHYDIPNTTVMIEANAFYSCKQLKSINIPYSVEYIDTSSIWHHSFNECTASIKIDPTNPNYKVNEDGEIAINIDAATRLKIIELYVKELVAQILKDYDIELKSEKLYDALFLMRPKGSNLDIMGILMDRIVSKFSIKFSEKEIVEINTNDDIVRWLVNNLTEKDMTEISDSYLYRIIKNKINVLTGE